MERKPVESSSIKSIGHDAEKKEMTAEFSNGSVYRYYDISEEEYKSIMEADSVGSKFKQVVKGKKYNPDAFSN